MLKYNADPDAKDNIERTPISIAKKKNYYEIYNLLSIYSKINVWFYDQITKLNFYIYIHYFFNNNRYYMNN